MLNAIVRSAFPRQNTGMRSTFLRAFTILGFTSSLTMAAPKPKDATPNIVLDPRADIAGVFAFRSYDFDPTPRVTFILCVDRLVEPANGPAWFPFDPNILYEIHVDNNQDAVADLSFQFRFLTLPVPADDFQAYVGAGSSGIDAPANSPEPVAPGTQIVPPRISTFDAPGFGQLQTYAVTMVKGRKKVGDRGRRALLRGPAKRGSANDGLLRAV